jgi:ketosteroid isomerase-like protein
MTLADLDTLRQANDAFYAGFEALDLDAMEAVWDHGEHVACVHPGAELVVGWPQVRRTWAAIFAATEYLQFIVTDVRAVVDGTAGIVTCTENILSDAGHGGHLGAARAVATNVFSHDANRGWRMVLHHGSPVADQPGPTPG